MDIFDAAKYILLGKNINILMILLFLSGNNKKTRATCDIHFWSFDKKQSCLTLYL
jgi:hypothetical protein